MYQRKHKTLHDTSDNKKSFIDNTIATHKIPSMFIDKINYIDISMNKNRKMRSLVSLALTRDGKNYTDLNFLHSIYFLLLKFRF